MLVVEMTAHLDPSDLIVHALRTAQHVSRAAVDSIWKFVRAASDRAPAEVGRKPERRILTGSQIPRPGRCDAGRISSAKLIMLCFCA